MTSSDGKLPNALLEMLAVIGLDEPALDCTPSIDVNQDPFLATFEPQILAAVSRHIALQMPLRPDDSYPPQSHRTPSLSESPLHRKPPLQGKSRNGCTNLPQPSGGGGAGDGSLPPGDGLKRRNTLCRLISPVDFVPARQDTGTKVRLAHLPLSDESLKSLTNFCFPDTCTIHATRQTDCVHYLALTNISGARTYAICLTHFEEHTISRKHGSWKCVPGVQSGVAGGDRCQAAYVPRCYVAICKHPYFTTIKDCLSRLVHRLRDSSENWWQIIKEFTLQMSMTPVPLGSTLQLEFQLFDVVMTIPAACCPGRPPLDFDLGIIFSRFDPQSILLILSVLLLQQRIVFTSSSHILLALIAESFLYLLHPFRWQLTYVPLLPRCLLELLEAPGTFIMGCHSKHQRAIDSIPDLIVVSLDQGTVFVPNSIDIPCLPKAPVMAFKEGIQSIQQQLDLWRLETLTTFSYEERRTAELAHTRKSNEAISQIFLDFMAHMFSNVLNHVNRNKKFFNKDRFLDDVAEVERPFYEKIFMTELFSAFLKERTLYDKRDDFTEAVRRNLNRGGSSTNLFALPAATERNDRFMASALRSARSLPSLTTDLSLAEPDSHRQSFETVVYRLPNFMYALSYRYTDYCFKDIVAAVEKCDQFSDRRAAFLFLRGALMASRNSFAAALEDFCEIHVVNSRLFPSELVASIMASMPEEERLGLENSELYKRSPVLKDAQRWHSNVHWTEQSVVMELYKIPEHEIDLAGFGQLLKMLQISEQAETIEQLFRALTLERSQVVDPATFQEFYKAWKQNEVEVVQAGISPDVLDPMEEGIVKVSGLIKCNPGPGHIVLTQDRLLLLEGGSHRCRDVVSLMDIGRVEVSQPRPSFNFFKKPSLLPSLKIYNREDKLVLNASFREETFRWHLVISEMWSGRIHAEEMTNPSFRHLGMQNALIVDAFLCSAAEEFCSHHGAAKEISPSLCYFLSVRADLERAPSSDQLIRCLDVNPSTIQHAERASVDALLFTAARSGPNDDDEVIGPRLWCGLSDGRLLVYNTATWRLDSSDFRAGNRIVCILLSRQGEIWAGSHDCTVYVLDNKRTLTCIETLFGHVSSVADMSLATHNRIFTASTDGLINVWDSESKVRNHKIHVNIEGGTIRKIRCHLDKLFCCIRHKILILSLEGAILGEISAVNDIRVMPADIDCLIVGPHDEVWVGFGKQGQIRVYNTETFELKAITVECHGVCSLVLVGGQVWAGSKYGVVYMFNAATYQCEHEQKAHRDRVSSACIDHGHFVFTGSGRKDGKIAIWKWPNVV